MSPSAVVQQVYLIISFLKLEQNPLLPTRNNMSLQSYFISEGMEFEPRWLLLFHQSAAADRRGDHPLYGAGTTGHRICTTAGNDCVIRPQEHTPCTDTLRHTPLIQYTSSRRFPLRNMNTLIARMVDFVAHTSEINHHFFFLY